MRIEETEYKAIRELKAKIDAGSATGAIRASWGPILQSLWFRDNARCASAFWPTYLYASASPQHSSLTQINKSM